MKTKTKVKPKRKSARKSESADPRISAPAVADKQISPRVAPHSWTDGGDKVLILRCSNKDDASHGGFRWPTTVGFEVVAPDFNSKTVCGGGLHGWPWGMGMGEGKDYNFLDDVWQVIAADPSKVIGEIEGGSKCKCERATLIYRGPFAGAWALINGGRHRVIDAMAKDGTTKEIASGYHSKAASSGDSSKAASSGDSSKAASSGDYCISASIGNGGCVKSGPDGLLIACWWDDKRKRFEAVTGHAGENGLKIDTWYRVTDGKFVEA